jgi:hypothetical protein
MSPHNHLNRLIINYTRRLQKLKEQQALKGQSTAPEILIEIEDIEAELARLQKALADLGPPAVPDPPVHLAKAYEYDVYISYVDQEPDISWVWEELVPQLEDAKLAIAVSGEVGRPGVAPVENIERALEQSKRIVLVVSPNYLADKQIANFESILGQTLGLWQGTYRLLPIKIAPLNPDQISPNLRLLDMLDLTQPRQAKGWFDKLLTELQRPVPLRGQTPL